MATNVVSVLNDLVETSKDGEKGFRKAAEDAHDAQLKTMFLSRAEDCMRGARELQDAVQALGGKPETGGSVSGALRRASASFSGPSAPVDGTAFVTPRRPSALIAWRLRMPSSGERIAVCPQPKSRSGCAPQNAASQRL